MFGEAERSSRGKKTVLRRITACGAAAASLALCVYVAPAHAAPKPPPNPTNQQLSAAAQQKRALAQAVGVLSAQIAQAQSRLQMLAGQAELAEQKYALAVSKLNDAKEQAARAQADVLTAQRNIDQARANLTTYVRNSYMSPTVGSSTIDLLTAQDPTALLQGGDYQNYISSHQLDAVGALNRATVAKSNADVRAKQLLKLQQQLTLQAQQAQQAAQAAYTAEQAEAAQLRISQASYQKQLAAAQLELAILNNQRARFVAYQKQQAAIAAARARAAALARQRAAEAAAAARRRNSGGGGGGGGGSSDNLPPAGSLGSWSASKGRAAADRALRWLGQPYAWAGGSYNGPTYGMDSPGTDGWNDSSVYGFDCSGLALYAWAAQGIYLPHYAASQYFVAGSFHPSPDQFMPGDLLFWSTGGADGIHHVAIYIGNGNVVQAPNSGDVVKVTPWDQVAWGYYGATRPMS
ncbi:MAG: NlpC/P60 family protein [Jatrophihabitantaceae bacterium]